MTARTDPPEAVTRTQALGYRAAVHHLEEPVADPMRDGVLLAGVQDSPPGRTAAAALRARGARVEPARLALVHSVRAAPRLHRRTDVAVFAAALRTLDAGDLAKEQFGPFGQELVARRISLVWAVDHVAEAIRQVYADGRPRTKGELSTALNEVVDARLRPWCTRCAVHHVHDALFRYATLQAGLSITVDSDGFRYVALPDTVPRLDPGDSRAVLARVFLRMCGPCRPEHLGRWLALSPAAARRLWSELDDQLAPVTVDGRSGWIHHEDLARLRDTPAASGVRLLPPYDPLTELADRELLLPDRAQRSAVWRPVGNPGVLLVRGEIAGIWRQRTTARRVTLTIQPFGRLTGADRRAAQRHAETLAEPGGPPVEAQFAP